MSNPINESGRKGEERIEKLLKKNNIPYQKSKREGIDFIINPNGKKEDKIYIDCKNQNVDGSVMEKLPHMVWKYKEKYDYTQVYIVEGKWNTRDNIKKHCNEICKVNFVKFDEMKQVLLETDIKTKTIERFF
jgi:hypothetical protein|tara:strand:- start:946 stop:1341 length:396 start_codon:yes stop_codon:yes gene_type:complete